jgi:hypothetical protein
MDEPPTRDDSDDTSPDWETIGRRVLASYLATKRDHADAEIKHLIDTLRAQEDPDVDDIQNARRTLNDLRRVLEEEVAPAAGAEPWGRPIPDVPPKKYQSEVTDG